MTGPVIHAAQPPSTKAAFGSFLAKLGTGRERGTESNKCTFDEDARLVEENREWLKEASQNWWSVLHPLKDPTLKLSSNAQKQPWHVWSRTTIWPLVMAKLWRRKIANIWAHFWREDWEKSKLIVCQMKKEYVKECSSHERSAGPVSTQNEVDVSLAYSHVCRFSLVTRKCAVPACAESQKGVVGSPVGWVKLEIQRNAIPAFVRWATPRRFPITKGTDTVLEWSKGKWRLISNRIDAKTVNASIRGFGIVGETTSRWRGKHFACKKFCALCGWTVRT